MGKTESILLVPNAGGSSDQSLLLLFHPNSGIEKIDMPTERFRSTTPAGLDER